MVEAEVLVIGNGGREQALAQAMSVSSEVGRIVVEKNVQDGLNAFSGGNKPFVVIGPEAPLVAGLADDLRADGYTVFGASKEAAQYEASKARATRMARNAQILHPDTFIAGGKDMATAARAYIRTKDHLQYVIKANGLAGGKGVVLPETFKEAHDTVEGMIDGSLFDGAGSEIINFQKRHRGPEVSAMVVVGKDKSDFVVLPLSQDHKRLNDGDQGPNTGGMGAYAPVPSSIVSPAQMERIYEKAYDSLWGMEAEGVTYDRAVLYMGLMMAEGLEGEDYDDSMLIEYNVRFGDPETQAILPLLTRAGVDVYRMLRSAAEGGLEKPQIDMANIGYAALSVCLAAEGYPVKPKTGTVVHGLDQSYEGVDVQLAGAERRPDGQFVTTGGRVLYVTGVGETIDEAATRAYGAIGNVHTNETGIHFAGMQYRNDIGWQARKAA